VRRLLAWIGLDLVAARLAPTTISRTRAAAAFPSVIGGAGSDFKRSAPIAAWSSLRNEIAEHAELPPDWGDYRGIRRNVSALFKTEALEAIF